MELQEDIFVDQTRTAAEVVTPVLPETSKLTINCPVEIRDMIQKREQQQEEHGIDSKILYNKQNLKE